MTARIDTSPLDEVFDTQIEVERNPCGAWLAIQTLAAERDAALAREAKLRTALEWVRANLRESTTSDVEARLDQAIAKAEGVAT